MIKSDFWLDSLYSKNEIFKLQNVAVNSQSSIDEQRNVKQPPLLLAALNLRYKFYDPPLNLS